MNPAAQVVVANFKLTLGFEDCADRGQGNAFFEGIDDESPVGYQFTPPSPLLLGESAGFF
jgi:hypothetical protein